MLRARTIGQDPAEQSKDPALGLPRITLKIESFTQAAYTEVVFDHMYTSL